MNKTETWMAWEYSGGQWTRIEDPSQAYDNYGDFSDTLRKFGYTRATEIGNSDMFAIDMEIYRRDDGKQDLKYAYLASIGIGGSYETVYCPLLPDVLNLLNLCSSGIAAAFLTGIHEYYEDALDILTRDAKQQKQQETRERLRRTVRRNEHTVAL